MPTSEARPLRFCDVCGGLDDHPRHVIDGVGNGKPDRTVLASFDLTGASPEAIEQLFEPTVRVRHIDCCAEQGCPVCAASEKVTKGKRGDALTEQLAVKRATADLEVPDIPRSYTATEKEN